MQERPAASSSRAPAPPTALIQQRQRTVEELGAARFREGARQRGCKGAGRQEGSRLANDARQAPRGPSRRAARSISPCASPLTHGGGRKHAHKGKSEAAVEHGVGGSGWTARGRDGNERAATLGGAAAPSVGRPCPPKLGSRHAGLAGNWLRALHHEAARAGARAPARANAGGAGAVPGALALRACGAPCECRQRA